MENEETEETGTEEETGAEETGKRTEQTDEGTGQPGASAPRSLLEILAALPEDHRSIVLGEVDKARKEAKGLRTRLKDAEPLVAKAKELEDAQKSAEDRAKERELEAERRATAALERVATAEIRAALTGVVPDPSAVADDLNISRFLTPEGDVDSDAISALREKYAALAPAGARAPKPNPAQGSNGGKEKERQLSVADLSKLTSDEINKLRHEGKLDHLMGRKPAASR